MKVFCVGGAVRDELLGLPVQDRDWVVVGSTPEEMLSRGFTPVGKDFPVFLHPRTHEEYALARTERKSGRGYHGFTFHTSPEVTLEEDLARRDLTINTIAKAEDGTLIDPFGGRADLEKKILRHVSPAFAEDPVRILRVARFAARFADFSIAPETLALMRAVVENGEVDHLVPERVWQELARGLMEHRPSRMFESLRACGALAKLLPELDRLWGVPQRADYHPEVDTGVHVMMVIDMAARLNLSLPARFAALTHDLGKGMTPAEILPRHVGHEQKSVALIEPLAARLKVPAACRDLALLVARFHGDLHKVAELRPETQLKILERCDALRRPARFTEILAACEADYRGRLGWEDKDYAAARSWRQALAAAQAVDAGAIAKACADPQQIPARIHEARVAAIKAVSTAP
ncbi:multifunctional CCA addition/repair protein [Sulfuricystis thermophila]|uniref:multifunctional CCA addition/repair protein n=1 Tax=Sulfuricystis thermophila TaxID=2496847 RepID=UPI0010369BEF|nr:multifunctional CCA addition/repair protein [Sulfuricystis thermophila]